MSFLDKMEQKATKWEKSENERGTILKEIRKENANLGKEEGKGARIVTTIIGVVVICWGILFIFDLVTGKGWTGITAMLCAVLTGLYWGAWREDRDRRNLISMIVSIVALVIVLIIHVGSVLVK